MCSIRKVGEKIPVTIAITTNTATLGEIVTMKILRKRQKWMQHCECLWLWGNQIHREVWQSSLFAWVLPEMVNRKREVSLIVHFLYQCHMGFTTAPPFRRLEAVLSPFILTGEMNMITDYDQFFRPIVTQIQTGPIFHKTHIFWTF